VTAKSLAASVRSSAQLRGSSSHSGLRRMRSQSGSPPTSHQRGGLPVSSHLYLHHQHQQQQQPLSLPPIQGTTIRSASRSSTAASSAKPSPPSSISATSTSSSATVRLGFSHSTGKVPLGGIMTSGIKSPLHPSPAKIGCAILFIYQKQNQ
jgi:hypothetical protein